MPRRQFRRSDLYNDLDWTKYDQEVGAEDEDRRRTGTTIGTNVGAPNPGIRTGGTPTAAGAGTRTGTGPDTGGTRNVTDTGAGTVTRGATASNRGTDRDHDQNKQNRGPQTGR